MCCTIIVYYSYDSYEHHHNTIILDVFLLSDLEKDHPPPKKKKKKYGSQHECLALQNYKRTTASFLVIAYVPLQPGIALCLGSIRQTSGIPKGIYDIYMFLENILS